MNPNAKNQSTPQDVDADAVLLTSKLQGTNLEQLLVFSWKSLLVAFNGLDDSIGLCFDRDY